MRKYYIGLFLLLLTSMIIAQDRIISRVDSTDQDNMYLEQTFTVNVSTDSVWTAYTTSAGWKNWATAQADIDFKINGLIRTSYDPNAILGDSNTIVLHIINYIPQQMLTLQAELSPHFPAFMQEDGKDLFNIVCFEPVGKDQTKVTSYGIGYKNNEKYKSLLGFFIQGNEQSYNNLINYLESGKPSVNY